MDFGSIKFLLIFLPLFTVLYWLIPGKEKSRLIFLASILFCGINSIISLVPLFISLIINYSISKELTKKSFLIDKNEVIKKKIILWIGIVLNLLLLLVFKAGVFNDGGLFQSVSGMSRFGNIMPLGISFYTFSAMAYLVDVYWKEQDALTFVEFGAFLTNFAKLSMGPIVRAKAIKNCEKKIDAYAIQDGIKLLIVGLGLKILLADRLNMLWHELEVTGYECISVPLAWLGALAFSLKLYFDFYGYSLMAIGIGRMMGYEFPDNFKNPYICSSVREFYRCWHMTLGQWFTRYIYIPLGGSRKGELRTVINLFTVWLLTALWHGFSVNFWLWGGLLFICIAAERQIMHYILPKVPEAGIIGFVLRKIIPHIYLIPVIGVSWILFAITDIGLLQIYVFRMFGMITGASVQAGDWISAASRYWKELFVGILCATPVMENFYQKIKDTYEGWMCLSVLFWICVWRIVVEGANPFMYGAF